VAERVVEMVGQLLALDGERTAPVTIRTTAPATGAAR
jgi:hypothetical protein